MIGRLKGIVIEKHPPHLLLDVSGVGYEVEAPMSLFYRLPEAGEEAIVYTHFVVREDAQLLYGFCDKQERELFRTLIKVNGVGPKLGLTILSGIDASEFVRCVYNNDTSSLVKLPGVGKKTAERLVVELKDKLAKWQVSVSDTQGLVGTPLEDSVLQRATDIEQEAVSALVALGYKPQDASKVVARVMQEDISSEELIRLALRSML